MLASEGLRPSVGLVLSPEQAFTTFNAPRIIIGHAETAKKDSVDVLRLIEEASTWLRSKGPDQWAKPWPDRKSRDARVINGLSSASRNARRNFTFFHEIAHGESQPAQSTFVTLGHELEFTANNRRKRNKRHARPTLNSETVDQLFTGYSLSVKANKLYAALIAKLWQSVMIAASIIISMVIGAIARGIFIAASIVAIISTIMSHRHRHEPADESLLPRTSIWVPGGLQ